jgi:hypothetical protein
MSDKTRNPIVKLEALRKNEHYKRHNIFNYDYTKDVCEQLLKNYWETIEAGRDSNPEMTDVWIDLTTAINTLDERTRKVVYAYAEGWRAIALVEKTGEPRASRILLAGILQMVDILNNTERTVAPYED